MEIPAAIKEKLQLENSASAITEAPSCADCMMQNHLNKSNRRYVVRPTDHLRYSAECKTFVVLSRRKFRSFRDDPVAQQDASGASVSREEDNNPTNTQAVDGMDVNDITDTVYSNNHSSK